MEPSYRLEGVIHTQNVIEDFEGPLNLILQLLAKDKIEIRDIKIAEILKQYLEYLEEARRMDLEIASEFVQMASHLLYIKSKTLLTNEEEVSELQVLIESLEQIKAKNLFSAVKTVTPVFAKQSDQGFRAFVKDSEQFEEKRAYSYRHYDWELLHAVSEAYLRGTAKPEPDEEQEARRKRSLLPKRVIYSVKKKSLDIIARLRASANHNLRKLYSESKSRSELVATFLSVLELCGNGLARITVQDGELVLNVTESGKNPDVDKVL